MATREILYRFGLDISAWKSAFKEIESLLDGLSGDQQKNNADNQEAIEKYADSVKEVVSQLGSLSSEVSKHADSIDQIADSYAQLIDHARTRLGLESQISAEIERQQQAATATAVPPRATPAPGASAPGSRGTRTPSSSVMAPEWQTATTKLRTDIAQEVISTSQVASERQRIVGLIDAEIAALKTKSELTVGERSDLQRLTLERERQTDAQGTGHKIGVTAGTKEALSGLFQVGGAVIGGEAGGLAESAGNSLLAGMAGGGVVSGIQFATEALTKFVDELKELIGESDRISNIENTFNHLASGIGTTPTTFIDDLSHATRGLVDNTTLMTSANRVMLQGLPLTESQITKLVTSISNLAIMQGKPLTESFDMVTRALSSGRLSMLAYNVGLDETTKLQLQQTESMPLMERSVEQLNIVMQGASRASAKVGEPIETLGTTFEKIGTSFTNVFDTLSKAIAQTDGVKNLSEAMISFANAVNTIAKSSPDFVIGFNAMFSSIAQQIKVIEAIAFPMIATEAALEKIKEMANGSPPPAPKPPSAPTTQQMLESQRIGAEQPAAPKPYDINEEKKQLEETLKIKEQYIQRSYDAAKSNIDITSELQRRAYETGSVALKDYLQQQEQQQDLAAAAEKAKNLQDARDRKAPFELDLSYRTKPLTQGGLGLSAASDPTVRDDAKKIKEINEQVATQNAAIDQKRKLDQMKLQDQDIADNRQATMTKMQTEYSIVKAGYDLERQALEESFKQEAVSGQNYIDQRKQLAEQDFNTTVKYAQERASKEENTAKASAELNDATVKAQIALEKELTSIQLSEVETRIKAVEGYYDSVRSLAESQLTVEKAHTAGTGITSPAQVALIQQTIESLRQENVELAKQAELALAAGQFETWRQIGKQINDNVASMIKYNQELARSRDILSPIGSFMSGIGNALSVLSGPGGQRNSQGFSGIGTFLSTIGGIQSDAAAQMASQLPHYAAGGIVPEDQTAVVHKGEQVVDSSLTAELAAALPKINNPTSAGLPNLAPLTAAATAAASALNTMASAALAAATASYSKGPGGGYPGAGQDSPDMGQSDANMPGGLGVGPMTGGPSLSDNPMQPAAPPTPPGSIETMITGFKALPEALAGSKDALAKFSTGLKDAVSTVSAWAQVASGRQGVVGGAIAGASAGASLGSQASSAIGKADPNIGAGPLAAITGGMALLGGIIGIFSAKARAATAKLAQDITDQFNNVIANLGVGTTNLNEAITQAEQLRAQAIEQLSGAKGGQDQLNQLLPQFNQEISQLQAQAAQVMQTFDNTAQVLSAPQPFQQYLTQFQSIISTYQQYVAAGGNVTEANQYLANSFGNLQIQYTQSLMTDQQDAIQNAINYNDLLVQQQQLVLSTNQSIENVMAAGNVTRQAPTAMTKGLQIAQIETQYQLQEQNLQEQISVAAYQVQSQQQMFNLASTRVGLELQLAAVQESLIDQQNLQVVGLQGALSAMSGGAATVNAVAGAIGGATSTATSVLAGLASIMQLMGLSTGQGFGLQVQQLLQQLMNEIPGLNPAQTLPGLFGEPVTQPVSGTATAPIPSYDVGTDYVPEDQVAMVHQGEQIIPASDVSNTVSAAANRLVTEQAILTTAQQRQQIEVQIYNLKIQEMAVLQALLDQSGASGSSLLLQTYQNYGRMGLGGFSGELG